MKWFFCFSLFTFHFSLRPLCLRRCSHVRVPLSRWRQARLDGECQRRRQARRLARGRVDQSPGARVQGDDQQRHLLGEHRRGRDAGAAPRAFL